MLNLISRVNQWRKNVCQKCENAYKKIKDDIVIPYLEVIRYLWVPAFTALLSLIFFACIDQTLEIYRVFALNPLGLFITIGFSFAFIFLLSFSIWYSGRALLENRKKDNNSPSNASAEQPAEQPAERWLPRVFGFSPLLALGLGFFRAMQVLPQDWKIPEVLIFGIFALAFTILSLLPPLKPSFFYVRFFIILLTLVCAFGLVLYQNFPENSDDPLASYNFKILSFKPELLQLHLTFGILVAILLANGYFRFVVTRKNKRAATQSWLTAGKKERFHINLEDFKKSIKRYLPTNKKLFSDGFLSQLGFSSFLVFSVFSFPLITGSSIIEVLAKLLLVSVNVVLLALAGSKIKSKKKWPLVTAFFCLTLFLIFVAFKNPPLSSWIGSVSIVALFLTVFVLWSSAIFYLGRIKEVPCIAILLVLAILSSSFDWNDNHQFRTLKPQKSVDSQAFPEFEDSFNSWIASRNDEIEKFSSTNKKYPIYMISAQGGGIYAAHHAALTLSRLHDSYPNFSEHIFAISGVSGGSLGAALFAGLVEAHESDSEKIELKADEVLKHDFLSPLLAAGLFPDFIQRFIPFSLNFVDRALGLEYAFEQAFDEVEKVDGNDSNPLRNSFYKPWKPGGVVPALILNTTVVETGDRLVLSPFKIDLPALKDIRTVADDSEIDFPLSTAAVLSARFTLVTPVGWFNRRGDDGLGKQKARLADGGYFENSGVSTAIELGSRLEKILKERGMSNKAKVIYLAITGQPSETIPKARGLNELLSPISALSNSRTARGLNTIAQAEVLLNGSEANPSSEDNSKPLFQNEYANDRFRQLYLHNQEFISGDIDDKKPFPLPLGWFLSKASRNFIIQQIGGVDKCSDDQNNTTHNDCVFRSIKEDLSLEASLSK